MTKNPANPNENAVELYDETVADLDTAGDPAGGLLMYTGNDCFTLGPCPGDNTEGRTCKDQPSYTCP